MNRIEEYRRDLNEKFPGKSFKLHYTNGNNVLEVAKDDVYPVLEYLKGSNRFDLMMNHGGADFPERAKRFDLFYELFSTRDYARLRVKTQVGENESIRSIQPL